MSGNCWQKWCTAGRWCTAGPPPAILPLLLYPRDARRGVARVTPDMPPPLAQVCDIWLKKNTCPPSYMLPAPSTMLHAPCFMRHAANIRGLTARARGPAKRPGPPQPAAGPHAPRARFPGLARRPGSPRARLSGAERPRAPPPPAAGRRARSSGAKSASGRLRSKRISRVASRGPGARLRRQPASTSRAPSKSRAQIRPGTPAGARRARASRPAE